MSAINIRLFHSSASVPPPLPEIETLRKTLATQLCGACHEPQVSAWIASKHAGAFGSLVARRQQSDRRCVACHVTVASLEPSGKLLGVFCNSCHQPDTQATSARFEARCEICHTEATDPDGHWQADIRSVCSTGALSSGTCVRQKMPAWQDGSERK
ncbi:MAG: hypothetical protein KDB90_14765 [Planctomycetes bacterium]|nr:hypothetical protein [Planctomycetota bacterium]